MNLIQEALEEVFAKTWANGEIEESRRSDVMAETIPAVVPELAAMLRKTLKRDAPGCSPPRHGPRRRNLARWCGAVDLLEMMWVISMEIGGECVKEAQDQAYACKTDALIHLHARALRITRETICLIHGGFADGALCRWRSLHEVAVTAFFLSQHSEEIAARYLASFCFSRLRAAEQLNAHAERADLTPFEPRRSPRCGANAMLSRHGSGQT
jgi:uncharacterized protein DUF5677